MAEDNAKYRSVIQQVTGSQDCPDLHDPDSIRKKFKHHPLSPTLTQFEERRDNGTLKRRADVEEPLINASHSHLMWRVDRGLAIDASAAVSDNTVTNDTKCQMHPQISYQHT